MANLERLKRRLVQEAVQENLDTIRGVASSEPPRESRAPRRGGKRWLVLLGLAGAILGVSWVLSSGAGEWLWSPRDAPAPAVGREVSHGLEMAAPSETEPIDDSRRFAPPRPLDPGILPLSLQTIVLDPGHGGDNHGTESPDGLVEKEITLDVARRLKELLERFSYEVVMTRDEDVSLSLEERAEFANEVGADILLSIHVNWIYNRSVRGVETYYLGATEDPYLTELAARENLDSGYSLADFREILERLYADVRQEESRRLAEAVQGALHESIREVNEGVINRGVKTAPFGLLMRAEMPSVLAEVSCVSNESEARLLMTPGYRQFLAEALFKGIRTYAARFESREVTGETS